MHRAPRLEHTDARAMHAIPESQTSLQTPSCSCLSYVLAVQETNSSCLLTAYRNADLQTLPDVEGAVDPVSSLDR